ncbi:MAG: DUF2382 domain-containing protein [Nostocaceae cyanobacterium]|nr:DUF2382 domain-containing protein [Nostocaceae cyanobacterium]
MEKDNQIQPPPIAEEKIVSLLGERLLINRSKRKIGEVVVRKKVETRLVQVPIRREILVVEKIGKEVEKLAEIDLGEEENSGVEINHIPGNGSNYHVFSEFVSPQEAREILDRIAREPKHGCVKVRIELVVENSQQ